MIIITNNVIEFLNRKGDDEAKTLTIEFRKARELEFGVIFGSRKVTITGSDIF